MRKFLLVIPLIFSICFAQKTTLKISAEQNFLEGVVVDLLRSKSDSVLYLDTQNNLIVLDSLGNNINEMVTVSISKPHYVREYYYTQFFDPKLKKVYKGYPEKDFSIVLIDNSLPIVEIKSNISDDKIKITYQTSKVPQSRLKIGAYHNGEIPIDKLNTLDSLSILTFDIDLPTRVTSYKMMIKGKIYTVEGNQLSDEIKTAFSSLKIGDRIEFLNVSYISQSNKYGTGGGNKYILPSTEFYIR